MRRFLLRLLTREVPLVYFSDGDVFDPRRHAIPAKPQGIVRENLTAREWRWKRVRHAD